MLSPRVLALSAILALPAAAPPSPPPAAATATATAAVGTQPGEFSVNANGAATYKMDLEVPPGTQGVEPALSIWYVSQNPNGLLGNGFTLQGLSSITRCAASVKLDGYNGGIGFDARDRFCLDGQRLVKIAGEYGAAGSIYHTENETWTQVTAVGQCGTGPCSFTALNKDGWTLDFGTSDSGVPLSNAPEIAAWQVRSSTDLNGNRITVSYRLDASTHQNLPVEILYTENQSAGITAARKITFEYEPRSQQIPRYLGGALFKLKDRLKRIRTWLDGAAVLEYNLAYTTSSSTRSDLLASVQKCTPQGQCYPATTFAYQEGTNALESPNSNASGTLRTGWCTEANALIGWTDFNGDGTPDLHCDTSSGTHRVLLSIGNELKSPNSTADGQLRTGWCSGNGFTPSWIDFNGDAKSDLACNGSDGSYRVLLSDGDSLASASSASDGLVLSNWCGSGSYAEWGNFDADGRADLLCRSSDGYHKVKVSTGTGLTSPNSNMDGRVNSSAWCTASGASMFWADFNGDTMSDAHCASTSGTQQVLLSTGTQLVSPNSDSTGTVKSSWCAGGRVGAADLNADRLIDSTCQSSNGQFSVLLSTGDALVSPNSQSDGRMTTPGSWCTGSGSVSAWDDFDGDSMSDLQCRDASGRVLVLLSTGTDLRAAGSSSDGALRTDWCKTGTPDWLDFDADSLGDVSCSASGTQQVLVHTPGASDLVTRITDGAGMTVSLTHAPLTDDGVYDAGSTATYPTLDIRSPLHVLSRYVISDGRTSQYAFSYRYKGARTDIEEHRWMGFQEISLTQEGIGRTTVTTYAQEYPLISFPTSTSVLDANGRLLASTKATALIRNPYENVWEVLTASETISTYTNGKADYTQAKNYEYDTYGNLQYVADVTSPYYEVYTCAKYQSSTNPWRIGYPAEQKTTRTSQACRDFLSSATSSWNASTDLRWSRTEYDDRMNVVAQKAWDDGNGAFLTVTQTFNAAGAPTSQTDAAGNATTCTWDDTSTYPQTVTSPALADGRHLATRLTFHRAFGGPATVTDPNGNVSATDIDGFGRTTALRGPDPAASSGDATVTLQTRTYAQDSTGRYVEMRQRQSWADGDAANWFYTREYYDGLFRTYLVRLRSAGSADVLTETLYDSAGREWKRAVPHYSGTAANYVITQYDALDRPTVLTQPDNTKETIEYLQGTMQVRTTKAAGTNIARTTVQTNDPRQLTLKSVEPNGGVITTTFDPLGQPLTSTLPTGRTTATTWDSLGRPLKSVDGNSGTTTWKYGTDGLLESFVNGAGNTVAFDYDSLNRPIRHGLIPSSGPSQVYTYEYDDAALANGLGQLTGVTGPEYSEEYAYSRYGLVSVEQLTIGGRVYADKADYDPARRIAMRTFPDGSQLRSTWFVDGTLAAQDLKENGGDFRNYAAYTSYDALGQPETLLLGNGLRTDYSYYPIASGMARPQTMAVAKQPASAAPLLSRTYEWDALNQLTSVQRARAGQSTETDTYTRNAMGWITATSSPSAELSYEYDLAGNITKQYGITYRYTSASDLLKESDDGAAFAYDGAGNLSSKRQGGSNWQYQHDASSRLASVLLNGLLVASHLYDSDDNRIRHVDSAGNVSLYLAKDVEVYQSGDSVLLTRYVQGVSGPIAAVTTAHTQQALAPVLRRQQLAVDPDRYSTRSLRGLTSWSGAVLRRLASETKELPFVLAAFAALLAAAVAMRTTPYVRRHPLFSSLIPFLVCGVVLLGTVPLHADLGPGDGYPTAGTLYFHGDQVDSTVLVTDSAGNESSSITFTPFGGIDPARSSGPDNFRPKFSSKERDRETGLDYFGARHYDSDVGRFLEPDPQAQFASAYAYAGNDPVSMIDPDGQLAAFVAAAIVGAVMGAYFGGVAANHNNYNPAQWDWKSGRTLAGMFAGATIGAASGALGAFITSEVGPAAGVAAEIVLSGSENAAFTVLGGGSGKQMIESFAIGAAAGAVLAGASAGISAALARVADSGSRLAQRGERAVLDDGFDPVSDVCASFPAGQTVLLAGDTLRAIESLHPGDDVMALDGDAQQRGAFDVVAAVRRDSDRLTRITTAGGTTIEATPAHGFYVEGSGWIAASGLRAGMALVNDRGTPVPIRSVETRNLPDRVAVHNITVDDAHTYYVSDQRVLVQNVKGKCVKEAQAKRANWRPSWQSGIRDELRVKQMVHGQVRSPATKKLYPPDFKITIGTKNPRQISGFAIDHYPATWAALNGAIEEAPMVITKPMVREIYNDRGNLRLIAAPENASHKYEPSPAKARKAAKKLVGKYIKLWKKGK